MQRALAASNGDFMIFLEKPISLAFLLFAFLCMIVPLVLKWRRNRVIHEEEG